MTAREEYSQPNFGSRKQQTTPFAEKVPSWAEAALVALRAEQKVEAEKSDGGTRF